MEKHRDNFYETTNYNSRVRVFQWMLQNSVEQQWNFVFAQVDVRIFFWSKSSGDFWKFSESKHYLSHHKTYLTKVLQGVSQVACLSLCSKERNHIWEFQYFISAYIYLPKDKHLIHSYFFADRADTSLNLKIFAIVFILWNIELGKLL